MKERMNMDNNNTASCPLCNHSFTGAPDEAVITCPECGVQYHKTCWEMNGGCSSPKCAQNPANKQQVNSQMKYPCPNCGCEIEQNVIFCPQCGVSVNAMVATPQKRYCSKCNTEILENQQFCPNCGYKVDNQQGSVSTHIKKKSNARIIVSIVIIIAVVLLAVGGFLAFNALFVKDIELNDHSINIEIDTVYELSYTITPNTALDKSVKWSSTDTNVATVDDNGEVTALDKGTATIIVETSNGKTDECVVTVAAKDFSNVYTAIGGEGYYCSLGLDGSYMEIDTNPLDIDDYSSTTAFQMVQDANNALGLPDSVWNKMLSTNSLDGRQTETYGDITVSWKYHPDNGLEVIYEYSN